MNIHEYQAKRILKEYGAPILKGFTVYSLDDIYKNQYKINKPFIIKSQIHAGGRGKGIFIDLPKYCQGGVRLSNSFEELLSNAMEMLGKHLVTKQTKKDGKKVNCLYVEEAVDIAKELYIALFIDAKKAEILFIASEYGGIEVENISKKNPEKLIKITINIEKGISEFDIKRIINFLNIKGSAIEESYNLFYILYKVFIEKDISLLEINPLVITKTNNLYILDAKIIFDKNAIFRHPEIANLQDISEEDDREIEALENGISYISLNGNIGCMVNGAGLAMATMDIIKLYGEEPANFLDVGGGASEEKVKLAFKIITNDKNVKGILVNIFGGIMHCDIIANGIISAIKENNCNIPIVVRLEGTNCEKGKKILANSKLNIISANDLDQATQRIISVVRKIKNVNSD